MSFYGTRQLSQFGAFGAFGGLELFPGGPSLEGGDSYSIFFDNGASSWAQGAKGFGITWTPPSSNILRQAGVVWAQLPNGSDADLNFQDATKAKMATLTASIDSLAGSHDVFHNYSQQVTKQLVDRMTDLKKLITSIAVYKPTPLVLSSTTRPASTNATSISTGADTAGGSYPGGAAAGESSTPWLLYVGIGLGALVVLGGAYTVLKPRMSGYRRRKRR